MNELEESFSPTKWAQIGGGEVWHGDSLQKMQRMKPATVDLCFTSPPFPLIRKKRYGNLVEQEYIAWLLPFVEAVTRLLKDSGSLVLDLGCCWERGRAVKSTYEMRLALEMIDSLGLSLAQEFYWYNPSRMPTPAQWVTIKKTRVKDSVNKLLWFSKSDTPKADNRRILQPYSNSMNQKLARGIKAEHERPSGHAPSAAFNKRNAGSIPGNLLAIANTDNSDPYLQYCREMGLTAHPARFPYQLAEFFIRFLTEPGDKVIDPFAGSCTTGYAAAIHRRRWVCIERNADYLETIEGHFRRDKAPAKLASVSLPRTGVYASELGRE